ncbi:AAA family ATPase [Fadolivirus algeromassiliense]|jgi:hypothetical protein|uniref:AAA family ATPase n=1 Tax=Fadolivirus FV1/VV64 TaxID=3070911 RepID=A0A7D3QTR5_9VIRU|nr:AAA family ATPase [Fadolivirus algeromassiliense]QKF93523.1 AAA family ATPase [Fadolivirus FV1/VV64]
METPKFDTLKKFADTNKLKLVAYYQGYTNFTNNLDKVFPGLTPYYSNPQGQIAPIFANITSLKIKKGEFSKNLPDRDITFYFQTMKGSDFVLIESHGNDNGKNSSHVDVVMCEDIRYIRELEKYLSDKVQPSLEKRVFIWDSYNGRYVLDHRKMLDKKQDDLIGLDNMFKEVDDDMNNCIRFRERLERFGESTGRNYMLYGPPGTGKSSFVRSIAVKYNIPIYNVKLTSALDENQLTNMLIPPDNKNNYDDYDDYDDDYGKTSKSVIENNHKMFKIVLLEDFDRYLEIHNTSTMSAILNALDGILPSFGVMRFFSANNPNVISHNKALQSRMHRTFFFGLPTVNQIKQQVVHVYDHMKPNEELITEFAQFAYQEQLSMRQITHYVCQFFGSDDPFKDIVHNMKKLVKDIQQFTTFDENHARNEELVQELDDDNEYYEDQDNDEVIVPPKNDTVKKRKQQGKNKNTKKVTSKQTKSSKK